MLYLNKTKFLHIFFLRSVTQEVTSQPPEVKDGKREINVLGAFEIALNVKTLFGYVALPGKGQHSFSSLLNLDRSIQN